MLLPLLNVSGYKVNFKQVLLLTYAGLRGAVGLCLALVVKFNHKIQPQIQGQVMFFTAGIVLLTLLINANTTGFLIRKLGMSKESEMAKRMLRKVLSEHDEKVTQFIQNWKKEKSETGDRGGLFYEHSALDFDQLKEFKNKLLDRLALKNMKKKYKYDLHDMAPA